NVRLAAAAKHHLALAVHRRYVTELSVRVQADKMGLHRGLLASGVWGLSTANVPNDSQGRPVFLDLHSTHRFPAQMALTFGSKSQTVKSERARNAGSER